MVFSESASGARTERPWLKRAITALGEGDVLVVTHHRLARSTCDLVNVMAAVSEKKVAFRSLRDGWADTTTAHGRLMLTVLGGLAEFQRELIRARASKGRARAKARGVQLGRPPKLSADQQRVVAAERGKGESVRHLARILGVSKPTIGRIPAAGA
jgi:DNA invertase Pin-like site-specific DNA recombinase